MASFSALKKNAKRSLRGYWGKAIGNTCLLFAGFLLLAVMQMTVLQFMPQQTPNGSEHLLPHYFIQQLAMMPLVEVGIAGFFFALEFLLLTPLSLGITRWYYQLVGGRHHALSSIFYYYRSKRQYGRSLWVSFQLNVRVLLWGIVFYAVPGWILGAAIYAVAQSDSAKSTQAMASVGVMLSVILFILAGVFYAVFMNRYFLATYLVIEQDTASVRQAIRDSIQMTKGYRFSLFYFQLSFIGWCLLSVLLFPIIYWIPYSSAAMALYACLIMEKKGTLPERECTREFRPAHPPKE